MRIILFLLPAAMLLHGCSPLKEVQVKCLQYKPENSGRIIDPKAAQLELHGHQIYNFAIKGVNNAYHSANFTLTETKCDIVIPDALKTVIPDGSIKTKEVPAFFFSEKENYHKKH